FSSRRRHTRCLSDWSSDVCSSDLYGGSVPLVDAWMFARLAATVELVNEALANYRFHEAAQGVYQFFWGDFCDWYIEWVKPELQKIGRASCRERVKRAGRRVAVDGK